MPGWEGRVEQLWFPGTHSDIGGQIEDLQQARPLSNIPLVWMLKRSEICSLALPDNWQSRFPTDPAAEMVGPYTGLAKLFLFRAPRRTCDTPFDDLHRSVEERQNTLDTYKPKAMICAPAPTMPDCTCPARSLVSRLN